MIRASAVGRVLYPGITWRVPGSDSVHLTFDDGPHPEITPWVLDQLDAFDAKATFFLVGKSAERYSGLVDQIKIRGHAIGNHTYSHLNGWRTSLDEYIRDVATCQDLVPPLGPKDSGLLRRVRGLGIFRPPFGKLTWRQFTVLSKDYQIIMWDVMPGDYNPRLSPEKVLTRIKSRTRPGSIIVLHENEKAWGNLKVVLPKTLEWASHPTALLQPRHPELVSGFARSITADAETSSA